jgi:hypothetical protein
VILVAVPLHHLRLRSWSRLALIVFVLWGLYTNQTRNVVAGIVLAGILLLVDQARKRPAGAIGTIYVGLGAVLAVLGVGGAIWSWLLRGGSSSRLTSLNGRDELWPIGFDALHGAGDWLIGLGFGTSKTLFTAQHAWATNAHNSLLGNLVNLGVIGCALTILILLQAAANLVRKHALVTSPCGPVLCALLLLVLATAVVSESLAEPGFGLALLYLIAVFASSLDPERISGAQRTVRGPQPVAIPSQRPGSSVPLSSNTS